MIKIISYKVLIIRNGMINIIIPITVSRLYQLHPWFPPTCGPSHSSSLGFIEKAAPRVECWPHSCCHYPKADRAKSASFKVDYWWKAYIADRCQWWIMGCHRPIFRKILLSYKWKAMPGNRIQTMAEFRSVMVLSNWGVHGCTVK